MALEGLPARTSLHFSTALMPDGWADNVRLEIADGRIVSVTRGVAPHATDERAGIGLPGLPNVHSHAFQRAMAGLTEIRGPGEDSFWSWREIMYRFVARLTPDDVEAIAAQAFMEMLEAGFTRVGEFHYLHHQPDGTPYTNPAEMIERIVAAAGQTGIGLTILPVLYAHGGFGGQPPHEAQRPFINDVDQYARLLERSQQAARPLSDAIAGVAPHSLRAVTPEELAAVVALAGDGPIHIHVAEQVREVDECVAWFKARPVEWLLDNAPVDARWCLVHATHMTETETTRLAASGVVAGLCPITEANLGDGVFNASAFLQAGGLFGVGTDSNVVINAAQELRQLEYSQRLRDRRRNVLALAPTSSTGRTVYGVAVTGGARALGVRTGLESGAPADLVSLAADHVAFLGRKGDQLLDSFVFADAGRAIDCVWRAGKRVVTGGRHRDRDAIEARFRRVLARLLAA